MQGDINIIRKTEDKRETIIVGSLASFIGFINGFNEKIDLSNNLI